MPRGAGASIIRRWLFPVTISVLLLMLLSLSAGAAASSAFAPTEGQEFSGQVGVALIACKKEGELFNCGALASTLSAEIRWGDGVADTVQATQTECKVTFCDYAVTGTHIYAEEGHYAVAFTVPNPFGVPNPREFGAEAEVADAALTNPAATPGQGGSEGHSGSYDLMSFADSNPGATPGDFTAVIDWGDGSSASAGTVTASAGGFAVSGNHRYAEEGTFPATVRVTDVGGQSAVATTQIAVADSSLTATPAGPLTATAGIPAAFALAHFSDADPLGVASDYTAMVEWGDGTASTGTVTADLSGAFDVAAAHGYSAQGIYSVSVRITDAALTSVRVATTVTVRGPTSGTATSGNGAGKVTGSGGAPGVRCVVPKLKGKKLAAARRLLEGHHCALGKVKRRRHARAKRGVVLSQTPKAGSHLREGSRVSLVITASKPRVAQRR
jgi:hypothetical protein